MAIFTITNVIAAVCISLISQVPSSNAFMAVPALNVQHPISLRSHQAKLYPSTLSPLFADGSSTDSEDNPIPEEAEQKSGFKKFLAMVKPKSSENMSLKKMGLSALLSYGWVSNMSYCISVSLAWFAFTTKTGLSPLAKGQWKPFLAVYAGFYVFNNFARPFRIALSVGVTKYLDSVVSAIQEKFKVSKKVAIGLTVFLFNIVGTCSFMAFGIAVASALSGVAIFPPKSLL